MFELNNDQRKYFGLEPIESHWEKVPLKGDTYRPETVLYFEENTIRKHILSTNYQYQETQYNELTENREFILPKTKKGKPKKLTASVLEKKTPISVFLDVVKDGNLYLGNHSTNRTFYSRYWEYKQAKTNIEYLINDFIKASPENHFEEIEKFRNAKRKNIKYKSGDFFAFKIGRTDYGFGRILFDINKARKKKYFHEEHGLYRLMGPPLIIKIYAYISNTKEADPAVLKSQPSLPSEYMMDNAVFYGDYEIIGHQELAKEEFDFPMSYGRSLDSRQKAFFQWGLIHLEKNLSDYSKFIESRSSLEDINPYGVHGTGFSPKWDKFDINDTINNNSKFDYSKTDKYRADTDLRNPKNKEIREELMKDFGLDPAKDYFENAKLIKVKDVLEIIKEIK